MLRDIVHETPNHQNGAPTTQTTPNTQNGQNGRGEEGLHQRFQQAFLQGLQQAQKEILQELRLTLLQVIQARFPNLVRLAKKQSLLIEDSEILRDLIVKMSIAQTNEEAVLHLLAVDEDEEEEEN